MVDGGGGGGGILFPVFFYDGEREINIGNVKIYPSLEYKPFQHMLSQKIGISPNQISIYLVDRKKAPNSSFFEDRRRMPITGKVNFGQVCRMKDCGFLAVLKRSRKARIRRDRTSMNAADYLPDNQDYYPQPMHHPVLLRRNQGSPFYDQIHNNNLRAQNYDSFPVQRVNGLDYEMGIGRSGNQLPSYGFDPNQNVGLDPFPVLGNSYGAQTPTANMSMNMNMLMNKNAASPKAWCEECLWENNDGDTCLFHPCINDVVLVGKFESKMGPIKRPTKQQFV